MEQHVHSHQRVATLAIAALVLGCGCGLLGGGSGPPMSGPPDVPWVTDPMIDVDVNGDGLADVVMAGVNGYVSDCPINTGCVAHMRIWYGNAEFAYDSATPDVDVEGVFGTIGPVGDINGDGYTDIWGTRGHATAGPSASALMLGGPGAFTGEFVYDGPLAPNWAAGDVNCDGYSDFNFGSGILYGGEDPAANIADAIAYASPGYEAFPGGTGVTWLPRPVGDVNGDGCSDVIFSGELIWGGPDGMTPSGHYVAMDAAAYPGPFDINGDGLDDVVADGVWLGDASQTLVQNYTIYPPGETDVRDITGDGVADSLSAHNTLRWPATVPDRDLHPDTFNYQVYRGGPESFPIDGMEVEPWLYTGGDEWVWENLLSTNEVTQFTWQIYWGGQQGSIGDFDGDGYRDYVIKAANIAFLYRGGDRLDRRDHNADGYVLNPTQNAGVAGITDQ